MSPKKQHQNSAVQYFKYSVIGLSCAALDIGVLNALLFFFPTENAALLTAYNTAAYAAAVLNSYIWNSRYTFQVKKSKRQILPFIIQALISLGIANLLFLAGIWLLGTLSLFPGWLNTNIAKGFSMFSSSMASFFFNKYFVFKRVPPKTARKQ